MTKARVRVARMAMRSALAAGCAAPVASRPGKEAPAVVPGDAVPSAVRVTLTVPYGATPRMDAALDDGIVRRLVTSAELLASADIPAPHSAWMATAPRGTLRVRVTLSGANGALGADSLALPLAPGRLWGVEALVHRPAAGIPAPPCFGCAAETRSALRADAARGIMAGDSLFLRAVRQAMAAAPGVPREGA